MITLITGGSGSGKSSYAENLLTSFPGGNRIYIATMFPYDQESFARIDRHRAMRAEKQFHTIECYTGLKKVKLPPKAHVLLECMSNLVANEMFQEDGAHEDTVEEILAGIDNLASQAEELVIVSNEIAADGVCYDPESQCYQQYLGRINVEIAKKACQVTEVVYGIPIHFKKRQEHAGKEGKLNEGK